MIAALSSSRFQWRCCGRCLPATRASGPGMFLTTVTIRGTGAPCAVSESARQVQRSTLESLTDRCPAATLDLAVNLDRVRRKAIA